MTTNVSEKKNYGKQFFSGVAVLAISTFIVKLIGMFYKIPMMTYLGSEGMGYFNSAYDIYSLFFVIATTGIPVAISILVSENKTQGRLSNIKRIYRISLIILGTIGFIGTLVLCVFSKEISILIRNDLAAASILAISPTLLLICVTSAVRGYFQGNQMMLPTAISQVIEALGKLILGLGFAIIAINKGRTVPEVAAAAAFGLTIGVALSLLFLLIFKLFYKIKTDNLHLDNTVDSNTAIAKKLVFIAIPITISSTILSLSKVIDMTMILGRLNDIGYTQSEANSIYGAYSTMAVSIYNLPSTIVSAIALPLVPLLASSIKNKDSLGEKGIISSSLKMTSLIAFPTGLGIAVFSHQILDLLFFDQAKEIEYVAPLLSLLGVSVLPTAMITITNAILQSYKQVYKPIISMIIGTIIKVIAAFLLIGQERVNIFGAPISTFLSVTAIVAINLYFIVKKAGKIGSINDIFVKPFIASLIAIVCGIVLYGALANSSTSSIIILPVIALVAILYFIFILLIKAINKNDILMLPKGDSILKILTKLKLI